VKPDIVARPQPLETLIKNYNQAKGVRGACVAAMMKTNLRILVALSLLLILQTVDR